MNTVNQFAPLFNHINRFVTITAEEELLISRYLNFRVVDKKAYLLSEGDVCQANHFVLKGCLRMYFIKENGQEQIIQFALDQWWLTDFMSFETQRPSAFFIQPVEDSEIVVLTKNNQENLFDKLPKLERYFRLMAQRAYGAAQTRLLYLFDQSAEERYKHFYNLYPHFVQRVPQYMLASLLHITPEVLSKLKAKK